MPPKATLPEELKELFVFNPATTMSIQPEVKIDSFIDNIISSYETRIQKIQIAFQSSETITVSSVNLFDNVHQSLNGLKAQREVLNSKICESMAKNGSLRKKDYHSMMSGILNLLDEKENEAERQFSDFIENQKEIAQSLKSSLLSIKDITPQDAGKTMNAVKEQLAQIVKLQELRKETVMKTFLEFQQMHVRMIESFEDILNKGDHIMIQDIKSVKNMIIKDFN